MFKAHVLNITVTAAGLWRSDNQSSGCHVIRMFTRSPSRSAALSSHNAVPFPLIVVYEACHSECWCVCFAYDYVCVC